MGVNARSFACKDTNAINDTESLARSGVRLRLEGLLREGGRGWGDKRRNGDGGAHKRGDKRCSRCTRRQPRVSILSPPPPPPPPPPDSCSTPARGGRGWKGRLRFVESRHEEQWSTQYLAAWRTEARQKPERHRGQHALSVEEQYEEGQPLFGRLLNKTRSHLWFDDVLLSLVNKSNMLFESRDLAKECVAQRFTRRCLLSFVRRHTSKVQRP